MKNSTATRSNTQTCPRFAIRRRAVMASVVWALFGMLFATSLHAQGASPSAKESESAGLEKTADEIHGDSDCRIIYLGFVGALEPAQNKSSGVVQIGATLRGIGFADVCARTFSPYVWGDALRWLLKHFPSHAGVLSNEELQHVPKVVLVGHSMGGWAMMSVARKLRSREIPVELTIQVDSVGITDYTLPRNVRYAAIFHAHDVLTPLTTKRLRLEDPSRTTVLANVTVKGAGHESITRDPRIRELVLNTIEDLRVSFAAKPVVATADRAEVPRTAQN